MPGLAKAIPAKLKISWDENGRKSQKYVIRENYIYLKYIIPGRHSNVEEIKSIIWCTRDDGKLCLKRKKETREIIYPSH